jgi:PAS domain S-box-containing protein
MIKEKISSLILETTINSSDNLHHLLYSEKNVFYKYNYLLKKYDYISDSIRELTGYNKDEINKKGFSQIVKKVIKDEKSNYRIDSEMEAVEERILNYLIECKDKKLKWVEDISFLSIAENNKNDYSIGILRDITELNELISNLYNEKNSLDSILELAEVVFVLLDAKNKITYVNKKGLDLLGYEMNELAGKNISDFLPVNNKTRHSFNNKENKVVFETSVLTKSGEEKIINWHNREERDEDGKIIFTLCSGLDITLRKKQERVQHIILEILEESNTEANLQEFFKFIHDSVKKLMPADNFYISFYNKETDLITFPYFIDLIDKTAPPKPLGKGLTEYVLQTGRSALINRKMDEKLVSAGKVELIGTPSAIWLGIPLKIQDNTIGVLVVQDYENENTYTEVEKEILEVISYPISRAIERKKVEEERNAMIEQLQETNSSKDKLFSLISHDLRSPFNSLLGFADILTNEYETLTQEEIKEYLNVINEASKSLYSMTNNLLHFSRFQMGTFEFSPVKISLKKIIQKNLKMLSGNIIKKQLNLLTNLEEDADVFVDVDMMNSILQNLVSNAVKFTRRGGEIRISSKIIPFFNQAHQIEVTIQDTGVGINKNDLSKIFKEHMHSTPGTEKEYGTGLGLLLVKEFIEKNNGHVKVKSKLNEGTSFIFSFPVAEASGEEKENL